jgi:hypothetical protein
MTHHFKHANVQWDRKRKLLTIGELERIGEGHFYHQNIQGVLKTLGRWEEVIDARM